MIKFELTSKFKLCFGKKLFQIRALVSFANVKEGELGGWIEKEENLSHYGDAWVYGDARVYGNAQVYGDARVYGDAWVFDERHILLVGPVGSRLAYTTFFRDADREITVSCGCFFGKLDSFLVEVTKTHGDNRHAQIYRMAAEMAKLHIDTESNILDLKPGDKVQIISKEKNDSTRNYDKDMEMYLGSVMTVANIYNSGAIMEEDHGKWFWNYFRIEKKVEEGEA